MFKFLKGLAKSSFAIFTGLPLFCAACCSIVALTFVVIKTVSTDLITLPFGKDSKTSKNIRAKADPTFDAIIDFFKGGALASLSTYTAVGKELKESATSGIAELGYARTPEDSRDPEKFIATAEDIPLNKNAKNKGGLLEIIKKNQEQTRGSMINLLSKIGSEGTKNQPELKTSNPEAPEETMTHNPLVTERTPTLNKKKTDKDAMGLNPSSSLTKPKIASPGWDRDQFKKGQQSAVQG